MCPGFRSAKTQVNHNRRHSTSHHFLWIITSLTMIILLYIICVPITAFAEKDMMKNSKFGYKVLSWKSHLEAKFLKTDCTTKYSKSNVQCTDKVEESLIICYQNDKVVNVTDESRRSWHFDKQSYFTGELIGDNYILKDFLDRTNFINYCNQENCLTFIRVGLQYFVNYHKGKEHLSCDVTIEQLNKDGKMLVPKITGNKCYENTLQLDKRIEPDWLKDILPLVKKKHLRSFLRDQVLDMAARMKKNYRVL